MRSLDHFFDRADVQAKREIPLYFTLHLVYVARCRRISLNLWLQMHLISVVQYNKMCTERCVSIAHFPGRTGACKSRDPTFKYGCHLPHAPMSLTKVPLGNRSTTARAISKLDTTSPADTRIYEPIRSSPCFSSHEVTTEKDSSYKKEQRER